MLEDPEAVSLLLDVDDNAEPHSTSMAGSGSAAAEDIETGGLLIDIDHNKTPRYSESENVDVETVFLDIPVAPIPYNPRERFHRARQILNRTLLIISFSALVFLIATRIVIATGTITTDRHSLYKTLDLAALVVRTLLCSSQS
jgi:hypothetical protein